VRRSGWTKIRLATAAVGALVLATFTPGGTAGAAPAPKAAQEAPSIYTGDQAHPSRDADFRTGAIAPTARQKAMAGKVGSAVRFNALGTPDGLSGRSASRWRPGSTPIRSRRRGSTHPQPRAVRPGRQGGRRAGRDPGQPDRRRRGRAAAQRFGDLLAGRDGLVAVAVKDGNVLRVTSSLSRDTAAPAPATLTADDALAAGLRDAG